MASPDRLEGVLPSDLPLLHTIGAPSIDPDGTRAAVSVLRPDLEQDEQVGGVWVVPVVEGGVPTRLTRGHRDTAPAFSPDGRWLAFLRAEAKGKPQLHVLPLAGGDPVCLTDTPLGVGPARWSPDSEHLVTTARTPEPGRYGTDPDVGAEAEPPRLITTDRYRVDGTGFLGDKPSHLLVVDLPPAEGDPAPARQVTDGAAEDTEPTWSPDGALLGFVRQAADSSDLRTALWVCRPDGSGQREVDASLSAASPAFSTDGTILWSLASEVDGGTDFVARTTGLWSVPLHGSAVPTRHSDPEADDLAGPLTVDTHGVLCHRLRRGAVELVRLGDGGLETVVGGARQVLAHDRAPGGVLVGTVTDPTSAGEVALVGGADLLARSDFGATLRATGRVHTLHELTVTAPDGYPVHGWVAVPPGDGPHPVLLMIHGGPSAQYGWGLFDEVQVAVTGGCAVVFGNPRGSAGYGEAHGRSIRQAMGTVDADDVLALLDGALADPRLDAGRVGVMGGSYGGYLTALLSTRTQRFAGAIVERGFLDPISFAGSSDIGWFFGHEYVGDDPAAVAAQSPMAAVTAVTTPTLVIHSEQDWRCPVEQGQRWYAHLRRQGVPTELLLFPGEGHELSRSGRPRHRLARFEHVLRWWSRHLGAPHGSGGGV